MKVKKIVAAVAAVLILFVVLLAILASRYDIAIFLPGFLGGMGKMQ